MKSSKWIRNFLKSWTSVNCFWNLIGLFVATLFFLTSVGYHSELPIAITFLQEYHFYPNNISTLFCLMSVNHTKPNYPHNFLEFEVAIVHSNVKTNVSFFFGLHIWMKYHNFIQLYFAIVLNRTCTFAKYARKSKMSNIDNQNPITLTS